MSKHIYVYDSFTEDQTQKLISSAGVSKKVDEFLTQKELDFLKSNIDKITEWPEHGSTSKYWGFSYSDPLGKIIKKWLEPKLQQLIGNHRLDFLAFQEAINPWKIHADIRWYSDKIPYKVVLMPLDVEPTIGPVSFEEWPETYTIAFKQYNFMRNLKKEKIGLTSEGNNDQKHWKKPINNPSTENLINGYQITVEEHEKYLSHLPYEHLEGLSIDALHKWTPRSAFYWDNTALHCADNFLANNIKTKRCFMAFTLLQD